MSAILFLWLILFRNDKQNYGNSPLNDKLAKTAHRWRNKTLINYMNLFINGSPTAKLKILVNKNVK